MMRIEEEEYREGAREWIGVGCETLSALFAGLFALGFLVLCTGFGDLREGGEAGMLLGVLTVPPVLVLAPAAILLRGLRRAVLAWICLCPFVLWLLVGAVLSLVRGPFR
jgi:hypothetical protein